ncbi:hypothetical protein AV656_12775 [Bhargavaea cecembensis]|uniref:Uncharacterized protein n=1 Tax=Bhargavaea cecembensis TaxID=394098 RepID=A0A163EXM2_9BACL|nr:hypothetical protein [Bhargavaea cecembensis]KZE37437.1 hypothetical protein AV656_12775 [Bhargavaea cecembensis]
MEIGITFRLKLFGSLMVILGIIAGIGSLDTGASTDMQEGGFSGRIFGLIVLVFMVSIGILMHGVAAVLERLDEKGEEHEHTASHTE